MSVRDQLRPGDVLLYHPKGIYGWIIRFHTGHAIGHVETYVGNGQSVASRDRIGVGQFPLRESELAVVCRPKPGTRLNWLDANEWFESVKGTPYGWSDILQFIDFNIDGKGIVCSPFTTLHCRSLGYDPFNGESALKVPPYLFLTSNCYDIYEVTPDGQLTARRVSLVPQAS
jgi:hypothetical protein